jgi:hypothetical protein
MNKFTTLDDAINYVADMLNLDIDGAKWVYENTDCPAWDDQGFTDYDFLNDPKIENIPAGHIDGITVRDTISDFIIGQIANAESPQAAQLAAAMRDAIIEYKENGGENENAFAVEAEYEDGEFSARCTFTEHANYLIMYYEGTDDAQVESLFNMTDDTELCRLAGMMLTQGLVPGFNG